MRSQRRLKIAWIKFEAQVSVNTIQKHGRHYKVKLYLSETYIGGLWNYGCCGVCIAHQNHHVRGQFHAAVGLPSCNIPGIHWFRKLGGLQGACSNGGWKGRKIKFLAPVGIRTSRYIYIYEGHLESKERFVVQRYLLIIGKKQNMQVL